MTIVCRTCSRINPKDANYCYYDGVALSSDAKQSGPLSIGSRTFLSPFVFPSGRSSRNFDELVLACYGEWDDARDLLRQGYLGSFLGGLGRADLAQAAKQAASASDADRGLDDFLSKLPSTTREPARLFAQPLEVNLGLIRRDEDRRFVLHLENQGMGLLYGSVTSDNTAWLALGEAPGAPSKVFQCRHDLSVPVQVLGKALRAGNKLLEGRLTIESNGGTVLVVVRAEVPVQPFPDGVLAGARTPRQVAERAKVAPREAAALFEKGAVAAWYEVNGWTYPVQGPASSGLGAVQQFFEALGLVKPPKVEISEDRIQLQGVVGSTIEHEIQVQAVEKRPVFAHATSSVPWLHIGRPQVGGRTARIPMLVPVVPALPGERLHGQVQVTANGNQRFTVEVTLQIGSASPHRSAKIPVIGMPQVRVEAPPLPWFQPAVAGGSVPLMELIPEVLPLVEPSVPATRPLVVSTVPEVWPLSSPPSGHGSSAPPLPPALSHRQVGPVTPPPRSRPHPAPPLQGENDDPAPLGMRLVKHLAPLAILLLGMLGIIIHDLRLEEVPTPGKVEVKETPVRNDLTPLLGIHFHDGKDEAILRERPTMRFGLEMLREKDPKKPTLLKRLTYDRWGRTNSTCLRVDGIDFQFGELVNVGGRPARWITREETLPRNAGGHERVGLRSTWIWDDKLEVTQTVEMIPGGLVPDDQVPGGLLRRMDTCLIRYTLLNKDREAHNVGIRFLLDTFIGANDGVPFTIPGLGGLCDTEMRFGSGESLPVPDFIQALEKEDLKNPGTIAQIQFQVSKDLEAPNRVTLGGWPDPDLRLFGWKQAHGPLTLWDVPVIPMNTLQRLAPRIMKTAEPDSAVTVYWREKLLPPNAKREIGFTYGLGQVASSEGKLSLTVGNAEMVQGTEFTLIAQVLNPKPGEKVTLTLPAGFQVVSGRLEQDVPTVKLDAARPISTVTWRIKAGRRGGYNLKVQSTSGASQEQVIRVSPRPRGVLD